MDINIEALKKMDIPQLKDLAAAIREEIVSTTIHNGGHLASNLGVVELTLALHKVFDTPRDKLIFDVGHQCYTHKLLTGRAEELTTIRQRGGLSGFPKRKESAHDAFGTGHSSTSLSAAFGMAEARNLLGQDHAVVAVIGDGALTGGMAWEALNSIGQRKTRLVIVLNDNEMSINRNVGAISEHLQRMRKRKGYLHVKQNAVRILNPTGKLYRILEILKNSIKYLFVHGVIFEELGIDYVGPVDGHDLKQLIDTFNQVRTYDTPVLVHVCTKKGQGYAPAEEHPAEYHGIRSSTSGSSDAGYDTCFSQALCMLAETDERLCGITAAMPDTCGLKEFSARYPQRFYDVGITEDHAATTAAGMAAAGMRPVFGVYNTFLQRAYDSVLHDICIQNLPVILAVFSSGITGEDGETHQGVFGLSYLNHIPNLRIYTPLSGEDILPILKEALQNEGPCAILMPKGAAKSVSFPAYDGHWHYYGERTGSKTLLLAQGSVMAKEAVEAQKLLREARMDADVALCPFVKPLDQDFIAKLGQYERVYTLEDNALIGGFGQAVCAQAARGNVTFGFIGVSDHFIPQGTIAECIRAEKMDASSIAQRILEETKA